MDADPRYLYVFWVLVREGSFQAAARALGRTQPAVSYQVRMLEEQVGTRLVERRRGQLLLTPGGERVFEVGRQFFAQWEALAAELRGGPVDLGRPLRIAAVSGFGRYVLFPLLSRPKLRDAALELRFPTAEEVLIRVEEGRCDVGFTYTPEFSHRLSFRPVWREEFVLVAPAAERARPRRLADLASVPFVTYDEHAFVFGRFFAACFGAQPAALSTRRDFDELEEVVATVADGGGWSIVPDFCVSGHEGVRIVRLGRRRCFNTIHAVLRSGAAVPREVSDLLATLDQARAHPL